MKMMRLLLLSVVALSCCLLTSGQMYPLTAQCLVHPTTGDVTRPVEGTITFQQADEASQTLVNVDLKGFSNSDASKFHGFHVHDKGDLGNNCKSTGGHYNPMNVNHGAPNDAVRHIGDLGHIEEVTSDGTIKTSFADPMIKLDGPTSIIGRAIVIHGNMDDFGKGGDEGSLKTGNAGPRLACCLIQQTVSLNAGKQTAGVEKQVTANLLLILTSLVLLLISKY